MVSKYLGDHIRTKNCVQKIFLETFKYQKTRNLFKLVQKVAVSNFCFIGRKILKQKRL